MSAVHETDNTCLLEDHLEVTLVAHSITHVVKHCIMSQGPSTVTMCAGHCLITVTVKPLDTHPRVTPSEILTGGGDVPVGAGLLEQSKELLGAGHLLCCRTLGKHNPLLVPLDLHPPGRGVGLGLRGWGIPGLAHQQVPELVVVQLQHIC